MDLTAAMELSRRGRPQAPSDPEAFSGNGGGVGGTVRVDPEEDERRAEARPEEWPDDWPPALRPGDFRTLVDSVAREMVELRGLDWDEVAAEDRGRWRNLAELALIAVSRARVREACARLRSRAAPVRKKAGLEMLARADGVHASDQKRLRAERALERRGRGTVSADG